MQDSCPSSPCSTLLAGAPEIHNEGEDQWSQGGFDSQTHVMPTLFRIYQWKLNASYSHLQLLYFLQRIKLLLNKIYYYHEYFSGVEGKDPEKSDAKTEDKIFHEEKMYDFITLFNIVFWCLSVEICNLIVEYALECYFML